MASSATWSFGNNGLIPAEFPHEAKTRSVRLKPSATYARGTVLGELTATPGTYGAYASGNADGTQDPKGILQYDCVTDASGNVTFGTSGTSEFGQVFPDAPMYVSGNFYTTELTGLDAGALAALGRLTQGVLANGILRMP